MKRSVKTTVLIVILLGAVLPASSAPAAAGATTYSGNTSARALDLSVPALNINPTLSALFKGLSLGVTFLDVTSAPSASGFASGQCEFLAPNASPTGALPCSGTSMERSSVSGVNQSDGDNLSKCAQSQNPNNANVVMLDAACGKSFSSTAGGLLTASNEAGVATSQLSLDLSGLSAVIESNKDLVVTQVQGVVTTVFNATAGAPVLTQSQKDALKSALGQLLESIKQGAKAGAIKSGASSSSVTTAGDTVTLESIGASASIGLLGLQDPLVDGLIIIEVAPSKARTVWNGGSGIVTGSADPAVATLKVRDLIDLVPNNDYIERSISTQDLSSLLAPLKGTVLETTLELASVSVSPPGKSVTASSSGVKIHALKGLGASGGTTATSCGTCDGGIILRLASANVTFSGVLGETTNPPLPVTGGRNWLFYMMMAILAAGATGLFFVARRLRRTSV